MKTQMIRIATAVALLGILLVMSHCTNDDELVVARARQELTAKPTPEPTASPTIEDYAAADEPEATPTPSFVKVYLFEINGTSCLVAEFKPCGLSYRRCDDHMEYDCMTNVHSHEHTETRLISESQYTDDMSVVQE